MQLFSDPVCATFKTQINLIPNTDGNSVSRHQFAIKLNTFLLGPHISDVAVIVQAATTIPLFHLKI